MKIKKIAIITDEPKVRAWFAEALLEVIKKTQVKIPLIIVLKEDNPIGKTLLGRGDYNLKVVVRRVILPSLIIFVQKALNMFPASSEKVELRKLDFLKESKVLVVKSENLEKGRKDLPEKVIKILKKEKISLLVNRSRYILSGKVIDCVSHGTWGFHLGNIREHRGARYLLKSYCERKPFVHVTLQKLNAHLDAGEIVLEKEVDVRKASSYKDFRGKTYSSLVDMLAKAIIRTNKGFKPFRPEKLGKVYRKPGLTEFVFDLFNFLKTEIRVKLDNL